MQCGYMEVCMASMYDLLIPVKLHQSHFIMRLCWLSVMLSMTWLLAFDFTHSSAFVHAVSNGWCSRGRLQAVHAWDLAESASSINERHGRHSYTSLDMPLSLLLPQYWFIMWSGTCFSLTTSTWAAAHDIYRWALRSVLGMKWESILMHDAWVMFGICS